VSSALDVDKDFNMLSLRDLLVARDLYHLHLLAKQHVVGTAIGRYLIRKADQWPRSGQDSIERDTAQAIAPVKPPRTLGNSEVRPYSWPCVLVFVDTWVDKADFTRSEGLQPSDAVPPTLYLPDGSRVPVCVVHAPLQEAAPPPRPPQHFPEQRIGGGYPILIDAQGEERFASAGCLVTDGHTTYALTNRHVTGPAGTPVYTLIGGEKRLIGKSATKQLTRKLFQEIYEDWPGKKVFVNLDIGLVEVEDVQAWTAQVFGLGTLGPLADLSADNLSLRLIDCPVRAYGAASGLLQGAIKALFYRYKSVGGFEYISDCLIGPIDEGAPLATRPGDSGTVWTLVDGDAAPRPIAVEWGAQRFFQGSSEQETPYVLATFLSTACNQLEVDVIRDWNAGTLNYWGAVGHYTIATMAVELLQTPGLKSLMDANVDRISFAASQINKKNTTGLSKKDFVPLADVPDLVWKIAKKADGGRGGPEHPGHFADMDATNTAKKTLLQLCEDTNNINVTFWGDYYTEVGDKSRGCLPFRVWQFFNEMKDAAGKKDMARFVCAAGTMAHYVGDACQPLHISRMFDGDPDDTETVKKRNRETGEMEDVEQPRAAGVHSSYEKDMVERHVFEIIQGLTGIPASDDDLLEEGREAAVAVVALMRDTFANTPPDKIVKKFQSLRDQGEKPAAIADALWKAFGDTTLANMADGCRLLAHLWESAWNSGGGNKQGKHNAVPEERLDEIYRNPDFVRSLTLDKVGDVLD
jgi:hypothetical protein